MLVAEEEPTAEELRARAITKEALLRFLRDERPESLSYLGQLEVLFEDRPLIEARRGGKKGPFHWITSKAAYELLAEGRIASDVVAQKVPKAPNPMRFFRSKSYRDWRTEAKQIQRLVAEFSDSAFTQGLGHHLELLLDSALAGHGFMIAARDVNEWQGKRWPDSNENLDRIYVRDGQAWGCEIKNTLPYIERGEFETKLRMCRYLGVRPLFVGRMFPEPYINEAYEAGGFALVLKNQMYPLGYPDLAKRVRNELGLPVICARALPDGDVKRFVEWHGRAQ